MCKKGRDEVQGGTLDLRRGTDGIGACFSGKKKSPRTRLKRKEMIVGRPDGKKIGFSPEKEMGTNSHCKWDLI